MSHTHLLNSEFKNKYIAEQLGIEGVPCCEDTDCNLATYPDFTTPEGMLGMLRRLREQGIDFLKWLSDNQLSTLWGNKKLLDFILDKDLTKLRDKVYEFLKEREG